MTSTTVFRIIFFLCISIGVSFLCLKGSHAEEGTEKPLELDSGLYYTIQKGDTLWDLSEHFYDSPWVWPDLWEKNQRIPNPHWIYPGQRIRLFSRERLETMVQPETEADPEEAMQPQEPPYYLYPPINSVGFIRKKPVSPSGTIFKVKEDRVMILLEGNIGAGKTTVGRTMAASRVYGFIEEPTSMWREGFASNMLQLFYELAHPISIDSIFYEKSNGKAK